MSIALSGGEIVITWVGSGALEYATSLDGPWTCIPGAVSGYRAPLTADTIRLYRLRP